MKDLEIILGDHPGTLAQMGEALAAAGISIEGGGAWVADNRGVAHFLFQDTAPARKVLEEKGITVIAENEVLVQRLQQEVPGQLGKITRMMQQAGINIKVLYSDHNNQLIMVVDDMEKGRLVSESWSTNVSPM